MTISLGTSNGTFGHLSIKATLRRKDSVMLKDKNIGFIGSGNMGVALLSGMIEHHVAEPDRVWCSDIRRQRLEEIDARYGVHTSDNNDEVLDNADIIIFAVKPQILADVMKASASHIGDQKLVISIAAGVPLNAMASWLPANTRLIRAMPNMCVMVQLGMTALVAGAHATAEDTRLAQEIFDAVGRTVLLNNESLMDTVTGLSGSGPAYIFMVLEALADGGVQMGLTREDALLLASQTILGAAAVYLDSHKHPAELKDLVTSPAGTTIAGIGALEKASIRYAFREAVAQATQRSRELGQQLFADLDNN